jgi:hypothetical protein
VARRTGNRTAAAAAGLLFLAPSLLSVWYIVRGIDILAVLLGVAGFFVIAEARERSGPQIAFATAIFVLAFYAKQTVVFPAAAAVAFIFSRDIKKGLLMAAGYGGGVLGVLFLLQFLTGGWFFENAFLTTSNNPYFFWLFLEFLWKYFLCLFIAFPIALFQACRGVSRQPNAWALYFFATLISIFLAGKIGAALSYFLPLFSATCICLGLFIGDSSFSEKRARVSIVVMLLMLVQAVALFRDYIPIPTHEDRRQAALLDEHIKQNPGEILVERIDSFATLNERELNIEAVQLPILVMREKVSPRILAGAIEKKEFSLIVYSGIHFGGIPVIKRAIFENYRAIDEVNVGLFYGKGTFLVLSPR